MVNILFSNEEVYQWDFDINPHIILDVGKESKEEILKNIKENIRNIGFDILNLKKFSCVEEIQSLYKRTKNDEKIFLISEEFKKENEEELIWLSQMGRGLNVHLIMIFDDAPKEIIENSFVVSNKEKGEKIMA